MTCIWRRTAGEKAEVIRAIAETRQLLPLSLIQDAALARMPKPRRDYYSINTVVDRTICTEKHCPVWRDCVKASHNGRRPYDKEHCWLREVAEGVVVEARWQKAAEA